MWHDFGQPYQLGNIETPVNFDGISCPDKKTKPLFRSQQNIISDAYSDLSYLSKEPQIESFTIEFWIKVLSPDQKGRSVLISLSSGNNPEDEYLSMELGADLLLYCFP